MSLCLDGNYQEYILRKIKDVSEHRLKVINNRMDKYMKDHPRKPKSMHDQQGPILKRPSQVIPLKSPGKHVVQKRPVTKPGKPVAKPIRKTESKLIPKKQPSKRVVVKHPVKKVAVKHPVKKVAVKKKIVKVKKEEATEEVKAPPKEEPVEKKPKKKGLLDRILGG